LQEGIDVRGYYFWSLIDNFEWAEGWGLRFGLIALDETTQARKPRPSAALFSRIIRENSLTPGMVEAYAPEVMDQVLAAKNWTSNRVA
jgi:beta-glucosidase